MTEQPEMTLPPLPAGAKDAILTFRHQTFAVQPGVSVRDAILQCNLNPETVLVMRDGTLITDEVIVRVNDRIRLVATVSGG
jgi:sulfur carrier protein ThiS